MARIDKAEHSKILRAVDGEGRRVAEVAAEHGCTPAAVYALLAKLRKAAPVVEPVEEVASAPAPVTQAVDLFATPVVTPSKPARRRAEAASPPIVAPPIVAPPILAPPILAPPIVAPPILAPPILAPPVLAHVVAPAPVAEEVSATVTDLPRRLLRPASGGGGVGASLARPGYGLSMRTADGDESMTPFRSLDDLLSAIKPILRSAARSPDAVWFSIQPVDLATLDSDAA